MREKAGGGQVGFVRLPLVAVVRFWVEEFSARTLGEFSNWTNFQTGVDMCGILVR
jgi:hypothetical protein